MANKMNPVQKLCDYDDCVIAINTALSPAFNLMGRVLTGIYMSTDWTAAGITFEVSYDDVTYYPLQNETVEYAVVAAADQYVALNPQQFYGARFVKVRSGTAGTPVNQAAARTLILACGIPSTDQ